MMTTIPRPLTHHEARGRSFQQRLRECWPLLCRLHALLGILDGDHVSEDERMIAEREVADLQSRLDAENAAPTAEDRSFDQLRASYGSAPLIAPVATRGATNHRRVRPSLRARRPAGRPRGRRVAASRDGPDDPPSGEPPAGLADARHHHDHLAGYRSAGPVLTGGTA